LVAEAVGSGFVKGVAVGERERAVFRGAFGVDSIPSLDRCEGDSALA